MKYYGMMYHGNVDSYDFSEAIARGSVYDALADANKAWNENNDPSGYQLLVVFSCDDNGNKPEGACNAYFQFVDTKSCVAFIQNQERIRWSSPNAQKWNGDAEMMR